ASATGVVVLNRGAPAAASQLSVARTLWLAFRPMLLPPPSSNPRPLTVTWTNNDSVAHNSVANNGAWNSGTIAPGGNFSMTFPSAGSFPYHCSIHPGMVGTVTVQ
ncbi:MAG: hypothetical protein JF610_00205, partial [Acidobacteria bacterium]|nr:hypothetical protein [Acidobacteriota bacterium]